RRRRLRGRGPHARLQPARRRRRRRVPHPAVSRRTRAPGARRRGATSRSLACCGVRLVPSRKGCLRMRRVFVLSCLIAGLLALPGAAQARYVTGFSENNPKMFNSPLFTALHTTIARYVLPWDFLDRPADKGVFDAWIANARIDGVRPLVSFYVSRVKPKTLPSATRFDKMFGRFRAAYPDVKDISPWNEANAIR